MSGSGKILRHNFYASKGKAYGKYFKKTVEQIPGAFRAGRFAGEDMGAQSAREQAGEKVRQDTGSGREEREQWENTGSKTNRGAQQTRDRSEEAQNVTVDTGRPMGSGEAENVRNKANEDLRQGRNKS